MTLVIDASVSAAWLLPDEDNAFTREVFLALAGNAAFVPAIWDYEIRNILIVNERRGRITREAADAAFDFLTSLNLMRDRSTDWAAATKLAREFSLTIYDAAYLELAIRLDASLATLDKSLISAARRLDCLATDLSKP